MSSPREAQLPLLLSISEGLSRGTDEMLRVSPQGDAIHPPSCSLAIREAVEEIKWLRAEVERLREEMQKIRERLYLAAGHAAAAALLSEEAHRKALEAKP